MTKHNLIVKTFSFILVLCLSCNSFAQTTVDGSTLSPVSMIQEPSVEQVISFSIIRFIKSDQSLRSPERPRQLFADHNGERLHLTFTPQARPGDALTVHCQVNNRNFIATVTGDAEPEISVTEELARKTDGHKALTGIKALILSAIASSGLAQEQGGTTHPIAAKEAAAPQTVEKTASASIPSILADLGYEGKYLKEIASEIEKLMGVIGFDDLKARLNKNDPDSVFTILKALVSSYDTKLDKDEKRKLLFLLSQGLSDIDIKRAIENIKDEDRPEAIRNAPRLEACAPSGQLGYILLKKLDLSPKSCVSLPHITRNGHVYNLIDLDGEHSMILDLLNNNAMRINKKELYDEHGGIYTLKNKYRLPVKRLEELLTESISNSGTQALAERKRTAKDEEWLNVIYFQYGEISFGVSSSIRENIALFKTRTHVAEETRDLHMSSIKDPRDISFTALSIIVKLNIAAMYYKRNQDSKAEEVLLEIIKSHPEISSSHYALARLYADRNDMGKAFSECKIAEEISPVNSEIIWLKAKILKAQNMIDESRSEFERYFKIFDWTKEDVWEYVRIVASSGRYKEATNLIDRIVKIYNPVTYKDHIFLAGIYEFLGSYELSMDHAKKCLTLKQGDVEARKILIKSLAGLDKFDEAWNECRQLASEFPKDKSLMIIAGVMFRNVNRYDISIKFLGEALSLDEKQEDPAVMSELAATYLAMNNYDSAIYWYEKALKINPKIVSSNLLLGRSYHKKGDLKRAEEYFKRVIGYMNNNWTAWGWLGEVYYDMEKFKDALECHKNAQKINDMAIAPLAGIAKTSCALKDFEQAEFAVKFAEKKFGDKDPYVYFMRAAVKDAMGEIDLALENAIKARSLAPKDLNIAMKLADIYYKKGEKGKAADYFAEVAIFDKSLLEKLPKDIREDVSERALKLIKERRAAEVLSGGAGRGGYSNIEMFVALIAAALPASMVALFMSRAGYWTPGYAISLPVIATAVVTVCIFSKYFLTISTSPVLSVGTSTLSKFQRSYEKQLGINSFDRYMAPPDRDDRNDHSLPMPIWNPGVARDTPVVKYGDPASSPISGAIIDMLESMSMGKKVVLGFDNGLGSLQACGDSAFIEALSELKRSHKYEAVFKNLYIVRAKPADLKRKAEELAGVDAELLVFARTEAEKEMVGVAPGSNTTIALIDETDFPPDAEYPLMKIVALALAQRNLRLFADGEFGSLELAGEAVPLESMNIRSLTVNDQRMVFKLLPGAVRHDMADQLRINARLREALAAA